MVDWKRYRLKFLLLILVVGGLAALYFLVPGFDKKKMLDAVDGLSTSAFVAAFILLPLAGAPISIFLIVSGLKFGLVHGSLVAAGCMLVHNVVAYWFTHTFLKQRIIRFLTKKKYKIPHVPDRHQLWFTAAFTGMPGIPYTPKLYLLALTNIPFRIYLGIGMPVYALSNVVYIAFVGAVVDVNWKLIVALALVGVTTLAVCYWLKKRLDKRVRVEAKGESVEREI